MAEHQLPKLTVRVRFSSPALSQNHHTQQAKGRRLPSRSGALIDGREPPWAINGPLAHRDKGSRRAVVVLVVALVDGVERGVQVVGDRLVGLAACVLVDQCSGH